MAWFLALQGPQSNVGQSLSYELQETADRDRIAQEMVEAAGTDGVVAIPAVFTNVRQHATVYIRVAAWGAWAFYQMSEEERRELMSAANPLINALAQAQAAKQQPRPTGPAGPGVLPRLV